ncbi:hypothetical protein NC651_019002 [Populus alba x Populus x berolinensis]|nr:hypothetical protein NC651_019002 [Populus alba x Populus x berolinensis]
MFSSSFLCFNGATSVSKTCWLVFLHYCQMEEELYPLDIKKFFKQSNL